MPFTELEIAEHAQTIENLFWSRRRPPLHLRDQIREGQRIEGLTIDLFFSRPAFRDPRRWTEEPIVRLRFSPVRKTWRIYWQRADLKWHSYKPQPERRTLADCLQVVNADEYGCFFG